jgi:hypothetical protein
MTAPRDLCVHGKQAAPPREVNAGNLLQLAQPVRPKVALEVRRPGTEQCAWCSGARRGVTDGCGYQAQGQGIPAPCRRSLPKGDAGSPQRRRSLPKGDAGSPQRRPPQPARTPRPLLTPPRPTKGAVPPVSPGMSGSGSAPTSPSRGLLPVIKATKARPKVELPREVSSALAALNLERPRTAVRVVLAPSLLQLNLFPAS